MEAYSGTRAMEAVPVEPVAEWPEPGGETGLEEPMSQLGLGGGPESYPEKPDEPDCCYYLRTGRCGYGNRCRFNHPRDRSAAMGALRNRGGEYPERVGQPLCQYYMRTGLCKFGASCKYHHPRLGVGFSAAITLNYYGYPLRPGEKECSYYVKTGQCKFGVTCKFHHPMPAELQVPTQAPTPGHGPLATPVAVPTPAVYPTVQSPSIQASQQYGILPGNWPVAGAAMLPGSYVPGSYGHMLFPPGVVPIPGWTPYQAPGSPMASPSTRPTIGSSPTYGMTHLPPSGTAYTGPYLPSSSAPGPSGSNLKENAFPARPRQPECPYYLRTGYCEFGSMCKYHHPPELSAARSSFLVSPIGLPLRPGAPLCSHYAQNGVCEFGLSCRFNHPMRTLSYSSSASSLTDIPVAPYPVGSTSATLAPSSSSSDLRPEPLSVSGKDAFSSHMSSMNSSSASIGSIISHSGHAPQSSFQHSVQSSTSSRVASSLSYGGQVCTSS